MISKIVCSETINCPQFLSLLIIIGCIVMQAQRDRLIREEQMLQEERLAAELEKRKLDGIRDEKMRQQIRETR